MHWKKCKVAFNLVVSLLFTHNIVALNWWKVSNGIMKKKSLLSVGWAQKCLLSLVEEYKSSQHSYFKSSFESLYLNFVALGKCPSLYTLTITALMYFKWKGVLRVPLENRIFLPECVYKYFVRADISRWRGTRMCVLNYSCTAQSFRVQKFYHPFSIDFLR